MVFNCLRHPWIFTAVVTAASIVSSLFITVIALRAADYGDVPLAYALAGLLPAFAVPVTVYPLVRANRRLRTMKSELETLALTDVLTGLPNRRAFFERAEEIFASATTVTTVEKPIAAMMLDIDRFKTINDTHGHNTGDTVLCVVATTIRDAVASSGATDWIVARLGGEEFAILVVGLTPSAVAQLADRIGQDARQLRIPHGGEMISTTVSIGVSLRRDPTSDVDTVLKAADDAVYVAKRSGRDRWSFTLRDSADGLAPADGLPARPAAGASAVA
jgi:diguanylate cyclase (GGDEF)-like protein